MKMLKNSLLLIILTLLSLQILVACSGDSDKSSIDEKKGLKSAADGSGGDLQYALNVQPPTIDPIMTTATATGDISRHIFESLVTVNSNYEPQPMLAESWKESNDGLIYTFKLRENVLFHNGKEMKAEDVVASMERWAGNQQLHRY